MILLLFGWYVVRPMQHLDEADTNNDGIIDQEEVMAYLDETWNDY